MASLQEKKTKGGDTPSWIIQFRIGGKTKSLFLGKKYSKKQAEEVKAVVEEIKFSVETETPLERKTRYYLATLSDDLRTRFENAGLIKREIRLTCGELWDRFQNAPERRDLAENTSVNINTNRYYFFRFFDEKRNAEDIALPDAKAWVAAIPSFRRNGSAPLSPATVKGALKAAKTVFRWAFDEKLIENNVFDYRVQGGDWVNKRREFYISPDVYYRLLDAAPNQTWRVIIAFSRIGALRCPSETLAARWEDVRWNDSVFVVHSSKSGRDRLTPLFSELRVELERLRAERSPNDESPYILGAGYRKRTNLRTQFRKIVDWAGVDVWERIFHNLRGSRSNELFSYYPIPQVERWIEQSYSVARLHYLHSISDEFCRAVEVKTFFTTLESETSSARLKADELRLKKRLNV